MFSPVCEILFTGKGEGKGIPCPDHGEGLKGGLTKRLYPSPLRQERYGLACKGMWPWSVLPHNVNAMSFLFNMCITTLRHRPVLKTQSN